MIQPRNQAWIAWSIPIFILVLNLSGCFNFTLPLTVNIQAAESLNSLHSYQSLPLRLTIYQLSEKNQFNAATFRQLWKQDRQTLAASLLEKQTITLAPGSQQKITVERNPKAKYFAVSALFRDPNNTQWRSIKVLPHQASTLIKSITIKVINDKVEIQ